jgi:integrase
MPKAPKRRPKRGDNAGGISQRKDGLWMARLLTGYDAEGKPQRRTFYGKTREEAEGKLLEAQHLHRKGLLFEPSRQTVGEFMQAWLEDCVKGSARPKTVENYGYALQHLDSLAPLPLAKLTAQHLQRLYREKQEEGLTRMVVLIHAVLHRALEQAVKWDLIPRNVADAVERPKVPRKEFQVLTAEEANRLLQAAEGDRLHALYVLALTCGLRQGELLGLKWEDLDLDRATLTVRRQLQWLTGQGPSFSEPKSAKSRRMIALPTSAVVALRAHRIRQLEERLALGPAWQDAGLVFSSSIGTPLHPSGVRNRSFHRLLERAGLPRMRFHDLRHSTATLLLTQGVHPKLIQELLGHNQISVTLDTYSHVSAPMLKEVATKMEELLTTSKEKSR